MNPRIALTTIGARLGVLAMLAGAALLLGGCAAETSPALRSARTSYEVASADPEVQQHAPVALHEAQQTLEHAETEWDDDHDTDEAQHQAYLVEKRVEIARARTEAAEAQARSGKLSEELENLSTRQTPRGTVITFDTDVLFGVDQATLKPGARQDLNRLASVLAEHPGREVTVEGRTDSSGSAAYNQELSLRRASAVASQLERAGLDPSRIEVRGYGESQPCLLYTSPSPRDTR